LKGGARLLLEINNKHEKCNICRHEYTSVHTEAMPGIKVYICNSCLEAAKHNFIWLCMDCGQVYIRNKKLVLAKLKNNELKQAYLLCSDMQIIQGIDMCIECNPEGILLFTDSEKIAEC
jgi:transposase-like protein